MKTVLSTLAAALALASGVAFAAPGDNAPATTQWDQSQEHLVRQFSQGFGFAIDDTRPLLVASADSASAGPSADTRARQRDDRAHSHLRHVKLPKHSH